MSHPLDGCLAKINRANEHIKSLEAKINAFFRQHPHRVVGKFNSDFTEYIFTATGPVSVPIELSVITGEVIHHLRSSLDHLVWALALKRRPNPPDRIGFPVSTTAEKFKAACQGGMIDGISATAKALIQNAQPYMTGRPKDHPFAILHALNNTDKHRLLLVVASTAGVDKTLHFSGEAIENDEIEITPWKWSKDLHRLVDRGTEVLRVRFARPVPKMEVEAEFTRQIAFDQFGSARLVALIPSLVDLGAFTVNTIKRFTGEF